MGFDFSAVNNNSYIIVRLQTRQVLVLLTTVNLEGS